MAASAELAAQIKLQDQAAQMKFKERQRQGALDIDQRGGGGYHISNGQVQEVLIHARKIEPLS